MEKKGGRKDKKRDRKFVGKGGQMHLSFGMIFSVILIAVFVFVVIIVIRHFLGLKDCALVGQFYERLQEEVDGVWREAGSQDFTGSLPFGIEKVCFADMLQPGRGDQKEMYGVLRKNFQRGHNLFLYPSREACGLGSKEILHLDLGNITKVKNPYCISGNGKVVLRIEKGLYEGLVRIR